MASRKRASGPVRARVLAGPGAAVDDERGGAASPASEPQRRRSRPSCPTACRRSVARSASPSPTSRLPPSMPPSDPARLSMAPTSRDRNAGFGGEPVVSHPGEPPVSQVSHPGSPSDGGMASPQVAHGEPPVSHPDASRRVNHAALLALLRSARRRRPAPPLLRSSRRWVRSPTRSHPSRFAGERLTWGAGSRRVRV